MLLSLREPEGWYRSASDTISLTPDNAPPEIAPGMDAGRKLLPDRSQRDRFEDPTAMMGAFVGHTDTVCAEVSADRLFEWTPGDGWEPICESGRASQYAGSMRDTSCRVTRSPCGSESASV